MVSGADRMDTSQGSGQCGRPELYGDKMLEEKYAEQSVFKNREKVAYKCVKGYRLAEGRRVRYCRDGRWEPLNMSCTRKQCGSAGEIQNGYYDQKGNLFGDKAYVKCNKGYVLKGDPFRECLDEGWSGAIHSCEEARSPVPALGRLAVTAAGCLHSELTNGRINGPKDAYAVGESLSFSCNVGHVPAGNTVTKCKRNGKWTPPLKCTVIKCPELKILNGTVNTTRVRFNETVNITCTNGFQLRGANPITCAASGSWAPAVPTCEPVSCGQCLWAVSCGQCPVGSVCGLCPVGSVLWAVSVGCVLWAVSCGLCPVGSVLWAVSCGLCPVGSVCGLCPVGCVLWAVSCGLCLWAVSCGLCPVGCVLWAVSVGRVLWAVSCGLCLWAVSCGLCPVGCVCGPCPVGFVCGLCLWAVSCGLCPVGCVLWAVSCGLCPVGSVLWAVSVSCGQCPVCSVLWAVSCGLCPVGSVLWAAS
ncbi:hypothetical protein NFI96_019299 [Prochilodus magdalenae]|nr:hypothetical protein NFI96_019299 [Prochilodus magdalenae]